MGPSPRARREAAMTSLVLDLETIRDPAIPPPEPRRCEHFEPSWRCACGAQRLAATPFCGCGEPRPEGAGVCGALLQGGCPRCGSATDVFLPPTFHRIVAIGYAILTDDLSIQTLNVTEALTDEESALRETFEYMGAASPRLVGWNSRGFDAPVLAARALALGIPFLWYYRGERGEDPRYRYVDRGHYDVKDVLGDHGAAKSASLDAVSKSIGLPGKVGVDGSMVGQMVAEGRIEEVCNYCACDVAQNTGILYRMELVRGRISVEHYRKLAWSLVREVDANPKLFALRGLIDTDRFCLGPSVLEEADRIYEEEREGSNLPNEEGVTT